MREAVLVLDMTRDSIAPEARAVEMRRAILPRVKTYLAWARGKGMPVVFVCSARRRTDKWFLKHWELANEIWKPGQEPIPEIFEKDIIVHKRRYSGFFASDLEITLREMDVFQDSVLLRCAECRRQYELTVSAFETHQR